ncbi:MAG: PAS domain S-box protein [Bacteroidales bacterium]|nr:PAS domain S-box protein [Bacteroidales bacterium]
MRFYLKYLLVPFVLVLFYLLFYLVYEDVKYRTIDEFSKEQLILAETAAQGIYLFFSDSQADLFFLAQFTDLIEGSEYSKTLMANYYESHKDMFEAITRVDASGTIMFTYPERDSLIGKDISYQKHIKQLLSTQQPVISDVFESVQGYPSIALHVPVFKNTEFVGSLALLVPITTLGTRYLGKIKIRGTGSVWLLTENGIELFSSLKQDANKSLFNHAQDNENAEALLEKIRVEHSGTFKSKQGLFMHVDDVAGKGENLIAFHRTPLGNTYWTIIVSYQEKEIYLAIAKLRNRLIAIFTLLVIIMSYYFYSLAKLRQVLREDEQRKEAEKILRESEEKFRTIFDKSPIGIEFYNADGMQINANKASLEMFGILQLSDVLKFNLFEGVSLDDEKKQRLRNREQITYQAFFDFEKVKSQQLYKTNKSGGAYFYYILTPLTDVSQNNVYGYLVQVQDITAQKKAEEEITMLAHALRSVNECVSITDMNNEILFVNQAFCTTYGYSASELIGRHVHFFRPEDDTSDSLNQIYLTTRKGGWKGELMNKRKDGTRFPIFLSTTVIQDKQGKVLGLIGVASDITERKRSELELISAKEKAEESDRLKSAFLANMSHEIRTPMNGILGFADLLKEPDLTGEQQQKYINIIEKSGLRMLNIINDIIDISKIEAGLVEISLNETNIKEQLEFIYNFFKPETEKKGLSLSLKNTIPVKYEVVQTDREKLYAVLVNLVKNAIKYTNKGSIELGCGMAAVTMEHAPLSLQFYLKDTGIGIARHRQDAIFDRFVQADIEDKNALQGAGLGLSITKAYVEMLGGKIWLESDTRDESKSREGGSIFYFTIPVNIKNEAADVPKTDPSDINGESYNRSLKILIVNDDQTFLLYTAAILKNFGGNFLTAKSGLEAVELSRSNPDLDLILMNVEMPGMNGIEATRQIRQFNKDVIIIAQTVYGMSGDKEKAIDAGCDDYISKPIVRKELLALIEKCFNFKK